VTRLFTTVSPSEMNKDPEFTAAALPEGNVSARLSANQRITCSGPQGMRLSGGRELALDATGAVPSIRKMPFSEKVEEFDASGRSIVVADNTKAIDDSISKWNDSVRYDRARASPATPVVRQAGLHGTEGAAHAELRDRRGDRARAAASR